MDKKIEKFQMILLVLYLLLFYIYGADTQKVFYSEIILLLFSVIELSYLYKSKRLYFDKHILVIILFACYCFLSFIWAIDANTAIARGKTVFLLALFLLISYNYFIMVENGIEKLLKIIMYSGFIFAIYIMFVNYNFTQFLYMLSSGERIGSNINNVNSIGLQLSVSAMIAMYFGVNANKKYYIFAFLPIVVALATASRKVVIMLAVGGILLAMLRQGDKSLRTILKKMLLLFSVFAVLYGVYTSNLFPTLNNRMNSLITGKTSSGKIDNSVNVRNKFIKAGFEQFKETPILGIGAGNSYFITLKADGWATYLHNNIVEVLSTLGIIGFILYYYSFLSIMKNCIQNKNKKYYDIIFIILLTSIIVDWGAVSYYNKSTYFYILLGILFYKNSKKITSNYKESNMSIQ